MRLFYTALFILSGVFCSGLVQAQKVQPYTYYPMLNWDTSPYESFRYTRENASWDWINFRLLYPNGYDSTAQDGNEYPLIVMLHGAGESGRMEWNNSTKTNTPYPTDDPRRDNNDHHLLFGGKEHLQAVESGRFPGFVLFPQNSYASWVKGTGDAGSAFHQDLEKAVELIEYLVDHLKIDPARIYIHGLSAGAVGTWLAAYKRPDLFAAALPMSAAGDPAMAEQLAEVPLWVFQGELDDNPRPWATKQTVEAVRAAGGEVRYTEYAESGHNTWNKAYREDDFFEWMLQQSKEDVGVPNQAPTVNAGEDKTIVLPTNTATFKAEASDPDGSIESYQWTQLSGPEATMEGVKTATLSLSALKEGTYTFRINVTDNDGAMVSDDVALVVNPAENQVPLVNAGEDQNITLPQDEATFTADASDPDGTIESYLWEKVSGPEVAMDGSNTSTLSLSELVEGTYRFKVRVTDNAGATASDEVKLVVNPKPNEAPTVNAGADKSITLPEDATSFKAEASDPDGGIETYAWEKVSGPAASLSGTSTPTLSLDDLVEGTYVFRITVTDDDGATASDEVKLVVNPRPNEAPTVNAGADKSITLPTNTATFTANATDPDGSIETYLWEKVSGPAATLAGTTTKTLSLSQLVEGTYTFRVSVADDAGASVSDEVKLVVNPAPNKAPTVNAGENKSITLPTTTASFTAEASDPDGTITRYLWEKVSGPSAVLSGTDTKSLSVSSLVEGVYIFRVTVTDNEGESATDEVELIVNPAANQEPTVNAGADKSITLPTSTATFTATASDPDGTIESYRWEKKSGPEVSMEGTASSTLSLSGLKEGTYVFKVTVADNAGAQASDEVKLVVNPKPNEAPTVNAGADKSITLPTDEATFTATATDPDGSIETYLWEKVSGPAASLAGTGTATLTASNLREGTYIFRITVADSKGATASDEVKLVVNPKPNEAPTVNAGADKSITLPEDATSFKAEASDPDGGIETYAWEKVSGPAASLSGTSTPTLSLDDLVEGTYVFRITVTDDDGATASDEVKLVVNPRPNEAPTVNAGADKSITLPTNTATFTANATDPDGTISVYKWEKVTGPAVSMEGGNTHTLSLTGLVEGSYTFRVTVEDNNGAKASDEVALRVNPEANKAPSVNAGEDKSITLPTNTASFTATASDPDGSISSYEWTKVGGPEATLSNAGTATLAVSDLVQGSYTFRVKVTDNEGATATDEVNLAVYEASAENKSPVASAGGDTTVVLPLDYVALKGSGSDSDGTIIAYQWEKVSGPEVRMGFADSSYMELAELQIGEYVFRLTVTDNDGASASDEMTLTVVDTLVNDLEPEDLVLSTVLVYPNPFARRVHVKLESERAELLQLTLTDASAKVLSEGSLQTIPGEEVEYTIDLSSASIPGGTYLIQIRNQEGTYRKVIKVVKR